MMQCAWKVSIMIDWCQLIVGYLLQKLRLIMAKVPQLASRTARWKRDID